MEKSNAWCYRGRAQHDILEGTMKRAYSQAAIDRARQELAAAAERGGDVSAAKQTVKAGQIKQFMANDPQGLKCFRLLVLQEPLQSYLNLVFKAEEHGAKLFSLLSRLPRLDDFNDVTDVHAQAFNKALNANLSLFTGEAGRGVIDKYKELVHSFQHRSWAQLEMSRDQVYNACCGAWCSIGIAYRRLVFHFEHKRFELLRVCNPDLPAANVTFMVETMIQDEARCKKCFDRLFTSVWLSRLQQRTAEARGALQAFVALLPAANIPVEKKHLYGQESRKPKSRGRAVTPFELGLRSYQKSVWTASSAKDKQLRHEILMKGKMSSEVFGRIVTAHAVMRRRQKATIKEVRRKICKRRRSSFKAHGEFRRKFWTPGVAPCSAQGAAECARLARQWRDMSATEKNMYAGIAAGRTTEGSSVGEKRKRFDQLLDEISNHPQWQAGCCLEAFGAALRPDLVDMAATRESKREQVHRSFLYDDEPLSNPKGTMQPEKTCHDHFGGVCCEHGGVAANNAANNFHVVFRRHNISHAELPQLVRLSGPHDEPSEVYLVLDMYGKGTLQVFQRMEGVPGKPGCWRDVRSVAPTSSQRVFSRIARCVAAETPCSLEDVTSLRLICYSFVDPVNCEGFECQSLETKFEETLDLRARLSTAPRRNSPNKSFLPFGLCWSNEDARLATDDDDGSDSSSVSSAVKGADSDLQSEPLSQSSDEDGNNGTTRKTLATSDKPEKKKPGAKKKQNEPPIPVATVPVVGGVHVAGIKWWEMSMSDKANCWICGDKIPVGVCKFKYQIKPSLQLVHQRSIHALCAGGLPMSTRQHDLSMLNRFVVEADAANETERAVLFENIAHAMGAALTTPASSASGSGTASDSLTSLR